MLRTISSLTKKDLQGKRVLLRVDFNVPIDKTGVTDDTRIREGIPTLKYLMGKKAKTLVITHLGRPEGKVVDSLKLDLVAARLRKLLGKKVQKLHECMGKSVEQAVSKMKDGEIILLENIRFHPEEEECAPKFTQALANLGDLFVNDAFAACHRKHASTFGVAKLLPAYAGLLIEKEIEVLEPLLNNTKKPLTLVIGGAKIDTKLNLIKNYFGKASHILVGGALANTFLAAEGYDIGSSLYESNTIELARETMLLAEKNHEKFLLPEDVVVADFATEYARSLNCPIEDVVGKMKILDIGPRTLKKYREIIRTSKTIVWNGPMGVYEFTPFFSGTCEIAKAITALKGKAKTYVGGGDTLDALKRCKIPFSRFTHVSTGGGALLEYLEGKTLPGLAVLKK